MDELTKHPVPGKMPSPPEHLVKQQKAALPPVAERPADWSTEWSMDKLGFEDQPKAEPVAAREPAPVLHVPGDVVTVDAMEYHRALEDRRQAETSYAEIYAQYLEVVALNEQLLRHRGVIERFKIRVRRLYRRALEGDQRLASALKLTQKDLLATERALSDLQLENESLRTSLEAHEESHKSFQLRLDKAEAAAQGAKRQFEALVEEFENRGVILDEADRKIREYLLEIGQLNGSLKEALGKIAELRDENLGLQNQIREIQMREASVAALNNELASAVTKAQKQIHELEDRLAAERQQSQFRITGLEQEIRRLKENRHAEGLVEQANQYNRTYAVHELDITLDDEPGSKPEPKQKEAAPPKTAPARPNFSRKQWEEFYSRWSHIIDELSSHSSPIEKPEKTSPRSEELISEDGNMCGRGKPV